MVFEKIRSIIAEQFAIDEEKISLKTNLLDDLDADSLDIVELSMAIEDEFHLGEMGEDDIKGIRTVEDLVNFVTDNAK